MLTSRFTPFLMIGSCLLEIAGRNVGGCKIPGADLLPLRLPVDYTIGSETLPTPAEGGTLHVSIGPYGSRFMPLSGDLLGEAKPIFIGHIARYRSDKI